MAMAAIAGGADSLMIEVHPNPAKALSDGPQSLTPERFDAFGERNGGDWQSCWALA
jgi:3-deoxy-7-phosphoheptulonate synthase